MRDGPWFEKFSGTCIHTDVQRRYDEMCEEGRNWYTTEQADDDEDTMDLMCDERVMEEEEEFEADEEGGDTTDDDENPWPISYCRGEPWLEWEAARQAITRGQHCTD